MGSQSLAVVATKNGQDTEGELLHVPLDRIETKEGFNSRTYFNPEALQELANSIKAIGVVQAITVRVHPEKDGFYALLAGERRWRAAIMAGLGTIPAMVRKVNDKEAFTINGVENTLRESLSPAEEAVQVRRMVDLCGGDRDEAAKQLGFSRRVVDARLLLLNATPKVREALASRQIKVGHAELLSCLPADKQDLNLARILETNVSVEDFRTRFSAYAHNLSAAIFDTTGCRGCGHNTAQQASLFETHIGEGRCTDHQCFEGKRQAKILGLKAEHSKTFNNVQLDSEKDESSYTLLLKAGPHGVGREQFQACLSCGQFGALMSTRPGEEGRIQTDVCFDVQCNRDKAAAYNASLKQETQNTPVENSDSPARTTEAKATARDKGAKRTSTVASTPKQVETIVHRFYRDTAALAVQENPRMGFVYAAYALLNDVTTEAREILKKYNLSTKVFGHGNLHKGIEALAAMENDKLKELVVEAAALMVKEKMENGYGKDTPDIVSAAKITLTICKTDLAMHFRVDREFIESHTKSGIEGLMVECGFDKWLNETKKDEKAFRKLMSMKNAEIVKEILSSGFDFAGFVPRSVKIS